MAMNDDPRTRLKQAHAALTKAEKTHSESQAATAKERALIEELTRESERLDVLDKRDEEARAATLRDVIKAGGKPSFPSDHALSKNAAARVDLEARRRAAEQAVSALAAEELERALDVNDARHGVELAARAIMRLEAARLTERWQAVEAEATALRTRLGLPYGPVWKLGELDDALTRAIFTNRKDEPRPELDSVIRSTWDDFGDALIGGNADARLDFTKADRAIAGARTAADESRAQIDAIVARMKTNPVMEATP